MNDLIEDKPRRLSKRRLGAIIEALTSRLAGEIDTSYSRDDYEEALLWAQQKRDGRKAQVTIHLLEVPVGRPSQAPALAKQAVRFCRRLCQRGIFNFEVPPIVDDARYVCKVRVGRRHINIFDDGSVTRSLTLPESWLRPKGGFDHQAFVVQSNRMHAIYLDMAAHARRCGLKASARADLNTAIQERLHHEHSDAA